MIGGRKIAIIGASLGQYQLCKAAGRLGYETYCFAWSKGAICQNEVDHFFDISITEVEHIAAMCWDMGIEGVLSNGSDFPSEQAALICERLGLHTTPYQLLIDCRDKYYVRDLCKDIPELVPVRIYTYKGVDEDIYPCVVKPVVGGGKSGVCFAENESAFGKAIAYAREATDGDIIVEEYIEGKEVSVESISYRGQHTVIQITDKQSSAAPHFVELGHHQPAQLSDSLWTKICVAVPKILSAIGYTDGPSHVELKYNAREELFLIEANLRGGGDEISNRLVGLSTGVDYHKAMIEVALDDFHGITWGKKQFAGIYYLCSQTAHLLPGFKQAKGKPWVVDMNILSEDLTESHSNFERNGHLVYCSDHKIDLEHE